MSAWARTGCKARSWEGDTGVGKAAAVGVVGTFVVEHIDQLGEPVNETPSA